MSLINDMLKNLEKRGEHQRDSLQPYFIYDKLTSSYYRAYLNRIILSVIVLSLIIGLGIFYFSVKKNVQARVNDSLLPIQPERGEPAAAITSAEGDSDWLKPAEVSGITVQAKENKSELSFLLTKQALYRVSYNNVENKLTVVIERAALKAPLPTFDQLNTPIERITSAELDAETQFDLYLQKDASIQLINYNAENMQSDLMISVKSNKKIDTTGAKVATPLVKTPAMESLLSNQYKAALNAAENNQYTSAILQLNMILNADPYYKDARASLAAILIDRGHNAKARNVLKIGLNDAPDYIPFIELKARILTAEGKPKQALRLLQRYTPSITDNPDYLAFLAALYERTNNDLLAIKLYKQLLSQNPSNGNWWFGLGLSLDKLGQKEDATDAYTKASTLGHLNPDAFLYVQKRRLVMQET